MAIRAGRKTIYLIYQRSSIYYHFISIFVPRKVIQDSFECWIPPCRIRIPGTGFRIPIVSGIPDSKVHDSEFQRQKFPGYRTPQEKVPGFWNRDYLKWAAIKQIIYSKREAQHFLSTNCDGHFKTLASTLWRKNLSSSEPIEIACVAGAWKFSTPLENITKKACLPLFRPLLSFFTPTLLVLL